MRLIDDAIRAVNSNSVELSVTVQKLVRVADLTRKFRLALKDNNNSEAGDVMRQLHSNSELGDIVRNTVLGEISAVSIDLEEQMACAKVRKYLDPGTTEYPAGELPSPNAVAVFSLKRNGDLDLRGLGLSPAMLEDCCINSESVEELFSLLMKELFAQSNCGREAWDFDEELGGSRWEECVCK